MSSLTIELPNSIAERLISFAGNSEAEIEKFVLIAVAEKLEYLEGRAKRANLDEFEALLAKIPNSEPEIFDALQ